MSDQDLHKLLGGYATNTLTDEEREALFAAALHDQQLFDALANEHVLKELLQDPVARARIVAALDTPTKLETERPWTAILAWIRRPTHLGLAGSLATALIAILAVNYFSDEAKFATSKQVLTEDRSAEVESYSTTPSQQDVPTLRFDDQESPQKDNRESSGGASEPSIIAQPETSSPQASPTERNLSEMKKESIERTRRKALPRSRKNRPPLPKRSQEKSEQDVSQGLPKDQKIQEQFESRQESLPSASAPPLEQSRSSSPSPPKISSFGLSETDRKDAQGTEFQDALADRERKASKALRVQPKQGNARDLFYAVQEAEDTVSDSTSMGGALSATPIQPSGLRYSVLKRDSQGTFKEVAPEGPFSPADELRLTIEVNREGYIYVLREKDRDVWETLYPALNIQQSELQIERVKPYSRMTLPQTGMLPINSTGTSSQLLILFSATALKEFQGLQKKEPPERINTFVSEVKRKADTQQQAIERVSNEQIERATYIIASSPQEAVTLLVELTLPIQAPSQP